MRDLRAHEIAHLRLWDCRPEEALQLERPRSYWESCTKLADLIVKLGRATAEATGRPPDDSTRDWEQRADEYRAYAQTLPKLGRGSPHRPGYPRVAIMGSQEAAEMRAAAEAEIRLARGEEEPRRAT
jgi:hypothetical protein